MTTTAKLGVGFGTLVAVLLLIVGSLVYWLRALDAQVAHLTLELAPQNDAVQHMGTHVNGVAASVADYLQSGDLTHREAAAEHLTRLHENLAAYRRVARNAAQQELAEQLTGLFGDYNTLSRQLLHRQEEGLPPPEDLQKFLTLRSRLSSILDQELETLFVRDVAPRRAQARASVAAVLSTAVALLVLGLGIAVVASTVVGRGIVKTEQTLRTTLSSIADAVITTDLSGRVAYWNPGAEALTGWTQAEAAGRPLEQTFQIVDEETRQPAESLIAGALQKRSTVGVGKPIMLVAKDGSMHPIDATAAPIIGQGGKVMGAVLVFRDVGERRQQERALQASEARKAAILNTTLDGVITIDHTGAVVEFNRAAEALFGYSREAALGQELAELIIPPKHRQAHRNGLARCLATGEGPIRNRQWELIAQRADGSEFPVEVAITRLEGVEPPQFTGFVRDISEHKRTQIAHEEQLRLLRLSAEIGAALTQGEDMHAMLQGCVESIVRNLDAAFARIWTLNEQENVLELQASAGLYTHRDGGHARVPVGRFKIGQIAQERKPHLTNSVVGDPRIPEQEWAKRERLVSFAGYPLLVGGHVVGVMAMFARHPLTQTTLDALASIAHEVALGIRQQRAAEELLQINETLEDRVRERTAQLAESNQALQRSNRELEQFASVASHDLQEPLRKIQAFGDRLQAKYAAVLDETGRDYVERMQAAAARMRKLIDDLLSFSRITTKAQPFEPVDLNEVAHEVISDLEERIQRSQGRVEIGPLPTLDADRLQMRQLLQNLISNGLKFHKPDTPPVVQIEAEVTDLPEHDLQPCPDSSDASPPALQPWVRLTVRDNGIGFEEIYLDRIFQVFQRLHGRLEYEGTGVGLAICRKIVERHGGNITARSQPGQGTAFLVTLPLRQSTTDNPDS